MGSRTIAPIEQISPPRRKPIRLAAGIVGALDTAAWLFPASVTYYWSDSDPATKGLDEGAAGVTTILFAITAAPALLLAARGRAPRTALLLAIAFPTVFLALLVAVALALP